MVASYLARRPLQERVLSQVDWPRERSTNRRFDLDWLDRRTRGRVSYAEQLLIERAFRNGFPGSGLFEPGVRPEVRVEFHRQRRIHQWGLNYLREPENVLRLGAVRGVHYREWGGHVDQLSLDGHLDEALDLVYELIDAAHRCEPAELQADAARSLYVKAAVVLQQQEQLDAADDLVAMASRRRPARRLSAGHPVAGKLAAQREAAAGALEETEVARSEGIFYI
ncbi:hypothetical protein JD292_11715 [Leucobacter sp. CSA2]|uniref:Uncharacterized protein n=1 Tax=Leucobacter edaphi TaxID=2796472 RepID=A0A934QFA1_9MICO|nr:hypothetical protein [Leucobacter edaphi]MBK0422739.1 hypothetical protein [Leucobacter edaphi]